MRKKKILVINSISLFPKVMASQDRVFNMIKRLSQDHLVDVVTRVRDNIELEESRKNLEGVCNKFHPIQAVNPTNSILKRKYYGLKYLLYYQLFKYPLNYFHYNHKYYLSKFHEIISDNNYDIVQVEYWYLGKIFESLKDVKLKVIDSHDILFEKRNQEFRNRYGENISASKMKSLMKYKELETTNLKLADLIIYISKADQASMAKLLINNRNIIIPTGQDIDYFKNYQANLDEKLILFYGSMDAKPNIDAFFSFYNKILPFIKRRIPGAKVMVVGANPPGSIKKLHNGKDLVVTGFVHDVRPYLAKANFLILPLDVAAGFRSRIVDVMAMGIPVIGTHKALDSIEMTDKIHGFVTDSNEEMANCAVKLLSDLKLRNQMVDKCKKFAAEKYSIDATYGRLSEYYLDMELKSKPGSLESPG